MFSIHEEQTNSNSSDIDVCNLSPNGSSRHVINVTTSTPHQTYKPRVNFHSIESLASSSLNTSSLTPISSPFSFHRANDTGYNSLNSSSSIIDKENQSAASTSDRKSRRKLADWQIWHLRQTFSKNRYPTVHEQEQIAQQILLPLSSVRIWFQNNRARSGKQ